MNDFIDPDWEPAVSQPHRDHFSAFWNLESEWHEPPNQRRGGWSGVSTFSIERTNGQKEVFFIKRQENHAFKSLRHPLRGLPTFCREIRNIFRFRQNNIPCPDPVYFGHREIDGRQRAILITRSLEGFVPLDHPLYAPDGALLSDRKTRRELFRSIAQVLKQMHQQGLRHNSLYPKHIFVRHENGEFKVRIIDLEKVKWHPFKKKAILRDLGTLNRRLSPAWTSWDRMRFFRICMGNSYSRRAARTILQALRHNHSRYLKA